jgi:hypothetical protein
MTPYAGWVAPSRYPGGHPHPDRLVRLRRDAAIERVRSLTKGAAVASVAAVAVLGVYMSRAAPGHASTPAGAATNPGGSTSTGGSPSAGSSGLSSPAAAPVQSNQPAPVVSGSS